MISVVNVQRNLCVAACTFIKCRPHLAVLGVPRPLQTAPVPMTKVQQHIVRRRTVSHNQAQHINTHRPQQLSVASKGADLVNTGEYRENRRIKQVLISIQITFCAARY